jgi:hypothetical protein
MHITLLLLFQWNSWSITSPIFLVPAAFCEARFVDRPRIAHILKHLVSTSFWLQNVMSSLLLPSIIVLQIDWQTFSCRFCVVASPLLARGESECEGACLPGAFFVASKKKSSDAHSKSVLCLLSIGVLRENVDFRSEWAAACKEKKVASIVSSKSTTIEALCVQCNCLSSSLDVCLLLLVCLLCSDLLSTSYIP